MTAPACPRCGASFALPAGDATYQCGKCGVMWDVPAPVPATRELLVRTPNPAALDQTLHALGGVVGQEPDGTYRPVMPGVYAVRAPGRDLEFLRFAIMRQGYGEVVGERDGVPMEG